MSAAPRGAHGEQGLSRPRRVPSPSPAAAPTLRYPSPAPARAGDRGPVEPLPPTSQARPPGLEGGGSGPRGARRNVQDVPRGAEKSSSVGAARLPKTGGLSLGYLSPKPPPLRLPCGDLTTKIQLSTVDHSVRGSMKTAANCVS